MLGYNLFWFFIGIIASLMIIRYIPMLNDYFDKTKTKLNIAINPIWEDVILEEKYKYKINPPGPAFLNIKKIDELKFKTIFVKNIFLNESKYMQVKSDK